MSVCWCEGCQRYFDLDFEGDYLTEDGRYPEGDEESKEYCGNCCDERRAED